jgi:hypothetical protein
LQGAYYGSRRHNWIPGFRPLTLLDASVDRALRGSLPHRCLAIAGAVLAEIDCDACAFRRDIGRCCGRRSPACDRLRTVASGEREDGTREAVCFVYGNRTRRRARLEAMLHWRDPREAENARCRCGCRTLVDDNPASGWGLSPDQRSWC